MGRCTVSGVGAGLEGLKWPPAELFSTTGGHHSSVGSGSAKNRVDPCMSVLMDRGDWVYWS